MWQGTKDVRRTYGTCAKKFGAPFSFIFSVVRLVFFLLHLRFSLGEATAVAALKSEAAVGGNGKEVADRVASHLQARLVTRVLEKCVC